VPVEVHARMEVRMEVHVPVEVHARMEVRMEVAEPLFALFSMLTCGYVLPARALPCWQALYSI